MTPTTANKNTKGNGKRAPLSPEEREAKQREKAELFRKLAAKRTTEVLKRLDVLGNCANRATYSYTDEQVERIFSAIDSKLEVLRAQFAPRTPTAEESFTL